MDTDLELDGEHLRLERVVLNGEELPSSRYRQSDNKLIIKNPPERFELSTTVVIEPAQNTALEGLYQSGSILLTQCEPQGFRRITYFLDRPDVMSSFQVRIEADAKKFPVLLSNGDRLEKGDLSEGRHFALWKDPFKKPSYLFALVAGPLAVLEDQFVTASGKKVALQIYTSERNLPRCGFAMESLKKAMRWDEERFGLEYDLSTYMIVSTDDFNAGAMENKGLNVFNSRLVLADPRSANDENYFNIESVVAHEYFHNWTGNRVTLRDWFHLSLKEGLTVFRDQEFSMDQIGRDLERISSVIALRESQFAEDAGPNAHPIRPESCYAVDNFFTSTIYEKGSEVIRMMQTMVGRPGFRRGMDLYFKRHDGQAVIIEDFAKAISDANNQEWEQFKLWYSQAGTPRVKINESFTDGVYSLKLAQSCPPTPEQPEKKPFHIPLIIGLLDHNGNEIKLDTDISPALQMNSDGKTLIHLKTAELEIKFTGLKEKPLLSLNREFSAPVNLDWNPPEDELYQLYALDTDAFNRFEARQKLMRIEAQKFVLAMREKQTAQMDPRLLLAQRRILEDRRLKPALKAKMMEFPSVAALSLQLGDFDAVIWEKAFREMKRQIGLSLEDLARAIYQEFHGRHDERLDAEARGERALKNWALAALNAAGQDLEVTSQQYAQSKIMTDQETALALLVNFAPDKAESALKDFHLRWQSDAMVLNKWWAIQASAQNETVFSKVKELIAHPDFNIKNPNAIYSLLGRFGDNLTQFHLPGRYAFYGEQLLKIDQLNPQVAARLSSAFDFCPLTSKELQSEAKQVLDQLLAAKLSPNSFEILSNARKSLN